MRKIPVEKERVRVEAHFREEGSVLRGDKIGQCEGFTLHLEVESATEERDIQELLRLAHRMCFTEAALTTAVPLTVHHRWNGKPLSIQ